MQRKTFVFPCCKFLFSESCHPNNCLMLNQKFRLQTQSLSLIYIFFCLFTSVLAYQLNSSGSSISLIFFKKKVLIHVLWFILHYHPQSSHYFLSPGLLQCFLTDPCFHFYCPKPSIARRMSKMFIITSQLPSTKFPLKKH